MPDVTDERLDQLEVGHETTTDFLTGESVATGWVIVEYDEPFDPFPILTAAAEILEDDLSSTSGEMTSEEIQELRTTAEEGDLSARYSLGSAYGEGNGVPLNRAEAVRWYHLAADQGNAMAQVNLGLMFGEGHGVTQDDAEAVRWVSLTLARGTGI